MLITDKSKATIEACRFCWMCRHICPIGNASGQERNNARGRAMVLSLVERGTVELTDAIDNVYECALCGACTKECATGWDPVKFTKEVRLEAAVNGETPSYILKMVDNIERTGNPYGAISISKNLADKISELPKSADTLLFLGQDARYKVPEAAINAISLLQKAGVRFTVLLDEPDSGYALNTLIGAAEETRQKVQKTSELLLYNKIIAFDPSDASMFLREYKEWGFTLSAEVETFPAFVAELIAEGSLHPRRQNLTAVFQDPALLARDLEETDSARFILDACTNRLEMLLYGKDTMWAGNLLMNEYMPDMMAMVAAARWENASASKTEVLVTASPSEYAILSKTKPEGMMLYTLEEIVLKACQGE